MSAISAVVDTMKAMSDEILSLRSRLAEAEAAWDAQQDERSGLYKRLAEAERDAARYRWLRLHNEVGQRVTIELAQIDDYSAVEVGHTPDDLDAAIDAFLARNP